MGADKICGACGSPNWYFLEHCHNCHKKLNGGDMNGTARETI